MDTKQLLDKIEQLQESSARIRELKDKLAQEEKSIQPLVDELNKEVPDKENFFRSIAGLGLKRKQNTTAGTKKITQSTEVHPKTLQKALKTPKTFEALYTEIRSYPKHTDLNEEEFKTDLAIFKERGTIKEEKKAGKVEYVYAK
jgi:uncharacterized coiled-coil DUF342 family protein